MLDGGALLDLYQNGRMADAPGRLAVLARAAGADAATLPLAELDRRIWALRADWLGAAASEAVCPCPACGGRLEFTLPAGFALPPAISDRISVAWHGRSHALRPPRLSDIGPAGLDPRRLGDGPWHDPGFAAAAARALQAADPALALGFAMTCPDCGRAVEQVFDPAGYFWAEIEDMARRLLHEVAVLARAFGWSEAEILALTPARRALYLAEVAP